ncbi:ABC transporter permease subunit [Anaerococcus sp. Marseille-P3915]|uniref:ABC transporter permease subunit n=1 Tax=Anaerococcus sp. Marseille-P3915 TaxID=2057799 RepID=UPI000D0BB563|nr:ABC transporter permease subunit [Anaerococcus sp. Marseille-P3915]
MNTFFSIIKKEMIYILRDKRTIVLAVLSPIIFICAYGYYAVSILNSSNNVVMGIKIVKYILTMILTVLMFLSVLTGALEIGVGEKERGTLYSLLKTGVNLKLIILGKYTTLLLQGIISLIILNLNMFILSLFSGNVFNILIKNGDFTYYTMRVNIVLLLCVMFFCSIELLISFSVKSFKEGQVLSFPIIFILLAPFYYALTFNFNIHGGYYYIIPFFNISVIFNDIINSDLMIKNFLVFLISNCAVMYVMIRVILGVLNKESVIVRR